MMRSITAFGRLRNVLQRKPLCSEQSLCGNPGPSCLHTKFAPDTSHVLNGSDESTNSTLKLLAGRQVAADWQAELAAEVSSVRQQIGRPPGLAVVMVGHRPDSLLYVSRKLEACSQVGIVGRLERLGNDVTLAELECTVRGVCDDPAIDGVLVQLPLPHHLDEERVVEALAPNKDVDGFHPLNIGRVLMRGRESRFIPCTALGVIELLKRSGIQIEGKTAVVVGDSNIVGLPLSMLFRDAGTAAVTVCHRMALDELFHDKSCRTRAAQRAGANVCLPRLPGPTYNAMPLRSSGQAMNEDCSTAVMRHHREGCRLGPGLGDTIGVHGSWEVAASGPAPPAAGAEALLASARDVLPAPQEIDESPALHAGQDAMPRSVCRPRCAPQPAVPAVLYPPTPPLVDFSLPKITRTADILVVGVGSAEMVKADWVKPGAVVVDVGINVVGTLESLTDCAAGVPHTYRVIGDVDFADVSRVASAITPVPGGIGPMTIAAVLHNTIKASKYHAGLETW